MIRLAGVLVLGSVLMGTVTGANANELKLQFQEDAPKDRFVIVNNSGCTLAAFGLTIDLEGSAAGLLFDTSAGGDGVNVFQPLEVQNGRNFLEMVPAIEDGARQLTIEITGLGANDRIVLTIDVDDTVPSGPMGTQMIATSEIEGASARLEGEGLGPATATFDRGGLSAVTLPGCA